MIQLRWGWDVKTKEKFEKIDTLLSEAYRTIESIDPSSEQYQILDDIIKQLNLLKSDIYVDGSADFKALPNGGIVFYESEDPKEVTAKHVNEWRSEVNSQKIVTTPAHLKEAIEKLATDFYIIAGPLQQKLQKSINLVDVKNLEHNIHTAESWMLSGIDYNNYVSDDPVEDKTSHRITVKGETGAPSQATQDEKRNLLTELTQKNPNGIAVTVTRNKDNVIEVNIGPLVLDDVHPSDKKMIFNNLVAKAMSDFGSSERVRVIAIVDQPFYRPNQTWIKDVDEDDFKEKGYFDDFLASARAFFAKLSFGSKNKDDQIVKAADGPLQSGGSPTSNIEAVDEDDNTDREGKVACNSNSSARIIQNLSGNNNGNSPVSLVRPENHDLLVSSEAPSPHHNQEKHSSTNCMTHGKSHTQGSVKSAVQNMKATNISDPEEVSPHF